MAEASTPGTCTVVSVALVRRHGCSQLCCLHAALCAPWEVCLVQRATREWHVHGGQVKPGETEEDAARRETFEEVGVLCDELYRIGTVPGVGGGVALFAAVRWYGVSWARECDTRVSWERLDALEDVQPSLSSLSASAPLLVAWVGKKHAPPRSVCRTLRLGAGAAAQDHTPSGAWGSLTPTRPRLFYNATHMVRCKKSRMGWCTLASHVHVVNVQTAQQLRRVSQYTKKTESHAGCLKEKQRQHVLKRTLAPVACALMPIQSPVTPHYG